MLSSGPFEPPDERAGALLALLHRAGEAALARQREGLRLKPDGTWLTDADLAAEAVLLEGLSRLYPGDTLLSEEGAGEAGDPGRPTWYVDPIDGTGAFTEGLAHWGPTICRVVDGALEVGAFLEPRTGDAWFAAAGAGAWLGGRRLHPPEPPADDPYRTVYLPSQAHRLGPLPWPGRTRSLGCSAAHLARVASGGAAATIVPVWQPWDVGCGVLLVREAGRVVTDWSGLPLDVVARRGTPLIAAAPSIVEPLVEAVTHALAGIHGS